MVNITKFFLVARERSIERTFVWTWGFTSAQAASKMLEQRVNPHARATLYVVTDLSDRDIVCVDDGDLILPTVSGGKIAATIPLRDFEGLDHHVL